MEFQWIHISDFHLPTATRMIETWYIRALVKQIRWQREHGFQADAIFATGDIANRGQACEYESASVFFDNVLEAAGLGKSALFMVPGNHDVDRRAARTQRSLTSEDESVPTSVLAIPSTTSPSSALFVNGLTAILTVSAHAPSIQPAIPRR